MKDEQETSLYRIVKVGMKALKRTNIPNYWSKFLKKKFTIYP